MPKQDRVDMISGQIESIWANFDTLFAELDETGWQQKHGQDWIFADVPYHLAYFDRFMAQYAGAGSDLPAEEQLQVDSLGAMGRWNAEQFALRPARRRLSPWQRCKHLGIVCASSSGWLRGDADPSRRDVARAYR
jgi:hypothetical protein